METLGALFLWGAGNEPAMEGRTDVNGLPTLPMP
jgi:hypothetical protein